MSNIIKEAKITGYPKDLSDYSMPKVIATFENGESRELFEFYPDEIDFDEEEFVGLTEKEAMNLKYEKDNEYLNT